MPTNSEFRGLYKLGAGKSNMTPLLKLRLGSYCRRLGEDFSSTTATATGTPATTSTARASRPEPLLSVPEDRLFGNLNI